VPKGSAEIFFRKVKFWNEDEAEEAPPVFVRIRSPSPGPLPMLNILIVRPDSEAC
jgi:hypothetical protein